MINIINIKIKIVLVALSISSLFPLSLLGQILDNEQVDVIKSFNPLIQDANKINFPPEPISAKQEPISLEYNVPDRLLPILYPQANLKPLAIAKEKQAQYFGSFARIGLGTQWTPLAEIFITEGKNDKFQFGAHGRYQSAHGQKIKTQDYTNTDVTAFANALVKKSILKTKVFYHQDINFYYGYDLFRKPFNNNFVEYEQKDLKQQFNTAGVQIDLLNAERRSSEFDYNGSLQYNYYWDRFKLNEQYINVDFTLKKSFNNKHHVSLQLMDDYSVFTDINSQKVNRNIFSAKAKYHFIHGEWNLFGAINPLWEVGIFHLFPDIGLQRSLYKEYIVLYNGWKMELRKNSYQSLTQQNPWLEQVTVNQLRNGWLEERFLGLKGTIQKFNYNIRFAQNLYRHMPVFVNSFGIIPNSNSISVPNFSSPFDRRTNILNLHTELGYLVNSNLEFNFVFDFNNFEQDVVARIYHAPRFMAKFNTRYSIAEKVLLQLDIIGLDGVYYIDYGNPFDALAEETDKKLKGTADINIGATYIFSKRFSFFTQLNNLASIKYQRFYLYQNYGFNAIVGATLHF